mmetsp:Transcript_11456/g.27131  ORF Transcript_11456/g.27131 Transcript_11456/m.27131 type:complete len:225 (-) Transcript_11456:15-689(-)
MDAIESVEREMEAVEAEVGRYADAVERAAVASAAQFGQAKTEYEASVEVLRKEAAEAIEKAERVQADVEEEERQTGEVVGQLEALKVTRDELPAELDGLREEVKRAEAERTTVEGSVESKRQEASYAVNELTRGVTFYKRLGLDFDGVGEDLLHLRFTKIDPKAPEREFSFAVHVTDDNTYVIQDVSPPVEGVAEMAEELNETNDFSFFVRRMRREFCTLVARE